MGASLVAQLVETHLPVQEMQENQATTGSVPGSGRSPGEGNGSPLQLLGKFYGQRSLAGLLQSTVSQRVGHN